MKIILNKLIVSPLFYFFVGHFLMIGFGSIAQEDYQSFFVLFCSLLLFASGWILMTQSLFAVGSFFRSAPLRRALRHRRTVRHISMLLVLFMLYIGALFGFPMLADSPSTGRLSQRQYWPLLSLIEYLLPIMVGVSYLANQMRPKFKKNIVFLLVIFFPLIVSILLAVRYIFLEVIFTFVILYFMHNTLLKNIKIILVGLGFGLVFFAGIQYLRSGGLALEYLIEGLVRRLFIVNHTIFKVSIEDSFNLPYPTYLTAFVKFFGFQSYNTGFILYNKVVHFQGSTQGYAPASVIGEVFINFDSYPIAAILIFMLGSWFAFVRCVMASVVSPEYRKIFHAFVCMEMFRLYAHTAFGATYALTLFWIALLAIWGWSNLMSQGKLKAGPPIKMMDMENTKLICI